MKKEKPLQRKAGGVFCLRFEVGDKKTLAEPPWSKATEVFQDSGWGGYVWDEVAGTPSVYVDLWFNDHFRAGRFLSDLSTHTT